MGSTLQKHDARVHQVLTKIRSSGLKLNLSKCMFGVTELTFLGHIISGKGIKPDPKKVSAIKDMPPPESKKRSPKIHGDGSLPR